MVQLILEILAVLWPFKKFQISRSSLFGNITVDQFCPSEETILTKIVVFCSSFKEVGTGQGCVHLCARARLEAFPGMAYPQNVTLRKIAPIDMQMPLLSLSLSLAPPASACFYNVSIP